MVLRQEMIKYVQTYKLHLIKLQLQKIVFQSA